MARLQRQDPGFRPDHLLIAHVYIPPARYPNSDAIGRQIQPWPPPGVAAIPLQDFGSSSRNITIVGVVRNFMNRSMAQPPEPQIFTLFRQTPGLNFGFKDIVVRTANDPQSIVPA